MFTTLNGRRSGPLAAYVDEDQEQGCRDRDAHDVGDLGWVGSEHESGKVEGCVQRDRWPGAVGYPHQIRCDHAKEECEHDCGDAHGEALIRRDCGGRVLRRREPDRGGNEPHARAVRRTSRLSSGALTATMTLESEIEPAVILGLSWMPDDGKKLPQR